MPVGYGMTISALYVPNLSLVVARAFCSYSLAFYLPSTQPLASYTYPKPLELHTNVEDIRCTK